MIVMQRAVHYTKGSPEMKNGWYFQDTDGKFVGPFPSGDSAFKALDERARLANEQMRQAAQP
jgi:hypothetical protein